MNLYIFNPSSDLALAAGMQSYTPPRRIVEYENRLALMPALYADDESAILIPDNVNIFDLPYIRLVDKKRLNLIKTSEIDSDEYSVKPWGWNLSLYTKLRKLGISPSCLPRKTDIDNIRNLSHRRTSIEITEGIISRLGIESVTPVEFYDVQDALSYLNKMGDSYIKLPWSTSGRGVLHVPDSQCENARRRVVDAINNQGSVLIEKAWNKQVDFATEWICENNDVRFCGYSIFRTDGLANYKGNLIAPQQQLSQTIVDVSHGRWKEDEWLGAIYETLHSRIAPIYSGPLGVDMLIDDTGNINPCVEVNMRMTMGHVSIKAAKLTSKSFWFTPGIDIW